jgi:hypothetical protein
LRFEPVNCCQNRAAAGMQGTLVHSFVCHDFLCTCDMSRPLGDLPVLYNVIKSWNSHGRSALLVCVFRTCTVRCWLVANACQPLCCCPCTLHGLGAIAVLAALTACCLSRSRCVGQLVGHRGVLQPGWPLRVSLNMLVMLSHISTRLSASTQQPSLPRHQSINQCYICSNEIYREFMPAIHQRSLVWLILTFSTSPSKTTIQIAIDSNLDTRIYS